jgi:hypothetical protein
MVWFYFVEHVDRLPALRTAASLGEKFGKCKLYKVENLYIVLRYFIIKLVKHEQDGSTSIWYEGQTDNFSRPCPVNCNGTKADTRV